MLKAMGLEPFGPQPSVFSLKVRWVIYGNGHIGASPERKKHTV